MYDVNDRTVQSELWRTLEYFKEQVAASLGEATADPLTPHELLLGATLLYMQRCNLLPTVPTSRLTGKRANPANVFRMLTIFAVAAWLEMIERWWDMPSSPERHLKMVCNVTPMDVFTLGQLVDEERDFSALPLTDHVCAMCGRLLNPPTATAHLKQAECPGQLADSPGCCKAG